MTADSGKNPFRPGVGARPPYLAGRDLPIRRFDALLRGAPEQPANLRVTGLRGVGKTVLLREFQERARAQEWTPAFLEFGPSHNTNEGMTSAVAALSERTRLDVSKIERVKVAAGGIVRAATSVVRFTWNDVTLGLDASGGRAGSETVAKTLFELAEFVIEKGSKGVVLLLDEAQVVRDEKNRSGEHPLSTLISAVTALQQQVVPIGLVLCGLPTLSGNLLRARSYTERMFRAEEIGSLQGAEARAALTHPLKDAVIKVSPAVVNRVVAEVEGYPYFVQLWGAELWDAAQGAGVATITEAIFDATKPDIYRRLDSEFYEPRITTLTPAEQDVLLATSFAKTYPPLLVSEINDVNETKTPANINVLLGRLVEAGVVYRIRKGQYEYTAPKFREFLARRVAKPGWHQ